MAFDTMKHSPCVLKFAGLYLQPLEVFTQCFSFFISASTGHDV